MNMLEFVASLVQSLAWPVAAVVIVLVLRAPLARALSGPVKRWKAGPSGVEVEYWEETIEAARAELEQAAPAAAALPGVDNDLVRLVEVSPRAAVMEAFARIEGELRDLVPREETEARHLAGTRLARLARGQERINDETLKAIEGMAVLRNLAAHGPDELDEARAREFLALADAVLFALRGAQPPS